MTTLKQSLKYGLFISLGIKLILLLMFLMTPLKSEEPQTKFVQKTITNTEIVKVKTTFDKVYKSVTIVKIKNKFYKGEGTSQRLQFSKTKSYMDCLFSYTHGQPLTKWEKFYYLKLN